MPARGRSDAACTPKPPTLTIDYHPEAAAELIDAAQYYEEREPDLGDRFLDAVAASLDTLLRNPMLGRPDRLGRRRWLVRRFPYVIVFRTEGPVLRILAIAHTYRKPGYWKSRDTGHL